MKVGLIGGDGKMGQIFKPIFEKYGHEILISSLGTELTNTELTRKSDVIILCVPLGKNRGVITEIEPLLTENKLLMDIASLKDPLIISMMKTRASVIGMHPLFVPFTQSIEGKTVVLCPARAGKWQEWITDILTKEKAVISIMKPNEHDKTMAYVQALIHFISLVFADTVFHEIPNELGSGNKTPVFEHMMQLCIRVLSQSSDLYANIEMCNEHFPKALTAFQSSIDFLQKIVSSKNIESFKSFYEDLSKKIIAIRGNTSPLFPEEKPDSSHS